MRLLGRQVDPSHVPFTHVAAVREARHPALAASCRERAGRKTPPSQGGGQAWLTLFPSRCDRDVLKHDDAMGECRVKLRSLTMGQTLDFVEALSTQGGLTFCVSWEEVAPYELKPGKMHVQVCYATDLIAADNNGLSDPYCKLTWLGQKGRTKIVPKTLNPEWDESFIFTGLQP